MNIPLPPKSEYSVLAPFDLDQRIRLAVLALGFFAPTNYIEMTAKLGRAPATGKIEPFTGRDFVEFLNVTKALENADRFTARIRELLISLERAGLLQEVGRGNDILLGTFYYFLRELTSREKTGILWLSRALGPEFIHAMYSNVTAQIIGTTASGDVHAGTALLIEPTWLLTCKHVISDMQIERSQRIGERGFEVVRQLTHATADVGLLQIEPPMHALPGLSFRNPALTETVFTLGYPRIPLSRSPAIVMQRGEVTSEQIETIHGEGVFLYSAIARPGNSGGPILSAEGHVVGMVTEELTEQSATTHMPFHAGIRCDSLRAAIADLNVGIELPVEAYQ